MKYTGDEFTGTVKEMIEFLQKFDENDKIKIIGGRDWCGEFVDILINGESAICE